MDRSVGRMDGLRIGQYLAQSADGQCLGRSVFLSLDLCVFGSLGGWVGGSVFWVFASVSGSVGHPSINSFCR